MGFFFGTFLIAVMMTILSTPMVQGFATKIGALDKPNKRKIHKKAVPRLGGLSLYFCFVLALAIGLGLMYFYGHPVDSNIIFAILLGSTIMTIVGIIDDVQGVSAKTKFICQVLTALIVFLMGIEISSLSNPFNGLLPLAIYVSLPLTVLWIVGVTNAINLIDGLDGLASGVTAISAGTFFFVCLAFDRYEAAMIMLVLAGVTLGFLKYNFFPAKIFLGDSGSLFLGFVLATASIIGVFKITVVIALIIPVLILGVPIFDTLFAIGRRVKDNTPLFQADNKHIHHMLLRAGFTQREAVLSIYIVCFLLSFSAMVMILYR